MGGDSGGLLLKRSVIFYSFIDDATPQNAHLAPRVLQEVHASDINLNIRSIVLLIVCFFVANINTSSV